MDELFLSAPALRYAVEMCETNQCYRVAVIVKPPAEAWRVRDVITDHLDMTQYAVSRTGDVVAWKNGSYIQLFDSSDTICRKHFALVLFSPSMDKKERKRAKHRWCGVTH